MQVPVTHACKVVVAGTLQVVEGTYSRYFSAALHNAGICNLHAWSLQAPCRVIAARYLYSRDCAAAYISQQVPAT